MELRLSNFRSCEKELEEIYKFRNFWELQKLKKLKIQCIIYIESRGRKEFFRLIRSQENLKNPKIYSIIYIESERESNLSKKKTGIGALTSKKEGQND